MITRPFVFLEKKIYIYTLNSHRTVHLNDRTVHLNDRTVHLNDRTVHLNVHFSNLQFSNLRKYIYAFEIHFARMRMV
jgi:endonuclease IV